MLMGWTAPGLDNGLNGPWCTFEHQQPKRGESEDAGCNSRDRPSKERFPATRLRCEGEGSVAEATHAWAPTWFRRQPAALPGGDGGVRECALLDARDREAWP